MNKDQGKLFENILNNIDTGISAINEKGLFTYYNETMEKIEGLKKEKVIGRHVLEIYPDLDENSSTLLKCLRTGKTIRNKVKPYTDKNGEKTYLLITYVPIKDDDKIVGVIQYLKNIDILRKLANCLDEERDFHHEDDCNPRQRKAKNGYTFDDFLTVEKELINMLNKIKSIALYDYNVLICGETGTGKEIIAQSIHNISGRSKKPFVAQNCAAVPENLLESIFFGTEKGSFTGAMDKPGLFEQANGGTLLLDELNSLPIYLQAKLLRVLQEGLVRRVGGAEERPVDVRVIATVNEKPEDLIREKRMRQDLFHRLGPIYISIPPLRERKADVDYLTRVFMKREVKLLKRKEPKLSKEVKKYFREYQWVGNVRELKNVVNYIILNSMNEDEIVTEHLPYYMKDVQLNDYDYIFGNKDLDYQDRVIEFEKVIIKDALKTTHGNVSEASKILGIKRQTLQYKIKKWDIE